MKSNAMLFISLAVAIAVLVHSTAAAESHSHAISQPPQREAAASNSQTDSTDTRVTVALVCNTKVNPDDTLQVTVSARVASITPLGAYAATASWDPDLLSVLSVGNGNYADVYRPSNLPNSGTVRFCAFNAEGRSGDFSAAVLRFLVIGSAGTAGLVRAVISEATTATTFNDLLPIAAAHCSFEIGASSRTADFDGDGVIEFKDFLALAQVYGSSAGDATYAPKFDLNLDGTIGFEDFLAFARVYGERRLGTKPPVIDKTSR